MNVVDFQLNKTIPRKHTHDYVKNNSKPKQTKSRGGQRRAPVNSRKPNAPNQGGLVNLYFMGGRSDLNGATMIQLPQGIQQAIPLQQAQGIGAIPVPVPAIPVPPVPVPPVPVPPPIAPGGAMLGAAPNPMLPVLTDIQTAIRENRVELDGIRGEMARNPYNPNLINDLTTRMTNLQTNLQTEIQNVATNQLNAFQQDAAGTNTAIRNLRTIIDGSIRGVGDDIQNTNRLNSQLIEGRLAELTELSKTQGILTLPVKRGGSKNEIGNLRTEYINNTLARPNLTEAERNYLLSSQRGVVQSQKDDSGDEAVARRDRSESPSRSPLFSPSIRTPIMQGGRADTMGASSRRPSQPPLEFSSRQSPTSINVSAELLGGAASSAYRRRESTGGGDPRLPPLLGMPSISAFVDSDDSGGGNEIVYRSDAEFREDSKIVESDFDENYH